MEAFLKKIKESSKIISTLEPIKRTKILLEFASALRQNQSFILGANALDVKDATRANMSSSLIDRLKLSFGGVEQMAVAIEKIAALKNPIGNILDGWVTPNGLKIEKVSIPIGVVGIIYESRPNVTSDTAALCFKSGNVCVLKGGKEAKRSNEAIATLFQDVLEKFKLPRDAISLLPDYTREGVIKFVKMNAYVDVIIPRGGEELMKCVIENSTIPIIKHDKGICHIFIDNEAKIESAIKITLNSKCNKTSACNALETLLVHEEISQKILPMLKKEFIESGTKLKGCEKTRAIITAEVALEDDYKNEYLDNILSIKVVKDIEEAIKHIEKYGSGHSESIITENYTKAELFMDNIGAACVYTNASTRFTDGGEFGFGAEVGISTNKIHARGPMGINELTTYKYKIYGKGQVRI